MIIITCIDFLIVQLEHYTHADIYNINYYNGLNSEVHTNHFMHYLKQSDIKIIL